MLMTDIDLDRTKTGVGRRLTIARQAFGLDQGEFAALAGIAASTYNQYETGKNMPDLKFANAICDAHRLTLDYIYRGDSSALRREIHAAIYAAQKLRNSD
jgi:transcriptional regulator with XRE-family HTH domain